MSTAQSWIFLSSVNSESGTINAQSTWVATGIPVYRSAMVVDHGQKVATFVVFWRRNKSALRAQNAKTGM